MSMGTQTLIAAASPICPRDLESAATELRARIKGHVSCGELMASHTTFHIGGPADFLVEPKSLEELLEVVRFGRERDFPIKTIGNGSNLLVGDKGIQGIIVRLTPHFNEIRWLEDGAEAGAGVKLGRLVKEAAEHGLSGLESLMGIPGTLGGALATNAGTDTGSISDLVVGATVLDERGELCEWGASQFAYRYRYSSLCAARATVVSARLRLKPGLSEAIWERMMYLRSKRASRQPLRAWSAGSAFKNPRGVAAGKVMDAAGAKGMRIGDAQVSRKHANFLINRGRATAAQMRELIAQAHALVLRRYGIDLELEIELVGE